MRARTEEERRGREGCSQSLERKETEREVDEDLQEYRVGVRVAMCLRLCGYVGCL